MKTYIAKWPNGTVSILTASDIDDLFWMLDEEGDPSAAEIFQLKQRFHLTTDVVKGKIEFYESYKEDEPSIKKLNWPKDML
jgi:hypothetical protein